MQISSAQKVTYAISTAVHSLVRINSFGQWKTGIEFSANILQSFTEVRHVILFWVNCPFLLFTPSLFKTHFKIMLPSATIYQAVYFVKVFKLKHCIHSCSIRISKISFPPHVSPYDTRQNSSSGRKGTFVFVRPGLKSLPKLQWLLRLLWFSSGSPSNCRDSTSN